MFAAQLLPNNTRLQRHLLLEFKITVDFHNLTIRIEDIYSVSGKRASLKQFLNLYLKQIESPLNTL